MGPGRRLPPITAEITQDETEIELRLANLCRSNSMPDPKRMFEKYYRHSGAAAQSGTGLGLYIVSQLCNRMAVTVHAEIVAERVILVLRFARAAEKHVSK
jgi:signal transduction histidine kinase